MDNETSQTLLIIDFGSQVTQLIARRLRECSIYCIVVPFDKITTSFLKITAPSAIILSGGPSSVTLTNSPKCNLEIYELGIPILGICYGQQLMISDLGGTVKTSKNREFGRTEVTLNSEKNYPLFNNIFTNGIETVWMSHGDRVEELAPGFKAVAHSPHSPFAITVNKARKFYGVQFHPEVYHTINGKKLLKNFCQLAGFTGDWTMERYQKKIIKELQTEVGEKKVICALSGGVDSSVVAVLLHKAIGDQLTCIFVNTGLLRKGESKQVRDLFKKHYNIRLIYADESDTFINALSGISDPEKKRKIIGNLFIKVFDKYSKQTTDVEFLAQGTLYPDVIESVSVSGGPSETIKSHHNVGGLPSKMNLKLIEPLKTLFKDEVRKLGNELKLPKQFINRHPFPGPGLAIRCPGEVTKEKLQILREADYIFIDQLLKHNLYKEIWQAFVVLLPVKTVGVMGDARTYEFACALRAVTSVDGMTADYFPLDHKFLSETSNRIINEVKGINRITYDITSKPPGTIEWE